MISTRDLSNLPDVPSLQRLMRSLAMLDAILCPDWQYRYFSFNSHWGCGERMGSMRNGQGDSYFALFNAAGCWLKGFDHESPMSPFARNPPKLAPGVLEGATTEFSACLSEPAFLISETTFCIWRRYADASWQKGSVMFETTEEDDPDGSARLLIWLDGQPQTYRQWAQSYYERDVSSQVVKAIYNHEPLDQQIVGELNRQLSLAELAKDIEEIGYPEQ